LAKKNQGDMIKMLNAVNRQRQFRLRRKAKISYLESLVDEYRDAFPEYMEKTPKP